MPPKLFYHEFYHILDVPVRWIWADSVLFVLCGISHKISHVIHTIIGYITNFGKIRSKSKQKNSIYWKADNSLKLKCGLLLALISITLLYVELVLSIIKRNTYNNTFGRFTAMYTKSPKFDGKCIYHLRDTLRSLTDRNLLFTFF